MASYENYWIFVVKEYNDYNLGSVKSIIDKTTIESVWPIGKKTRYRNLLKKGDKVILFLSGERNQVFIADFVINDSLQTGGSERFDFIKICKFKKWRRRVEIKPLLNRLNFIKNQTRWGGQFQGGVVKITKSDYQKIIKKQMKKNM